VSKGKKSDVVGRTQAQLILRKARRDYPGRVAGKDGRFKNLIFPRTRASKRRGATMNRPGEKNGCTGVIEFRPEPLRPDL